MPCPKFPTNLILLRVPWARIKAEKTANPTLTIDHEQCDRVNIPESALCKCVRPCPDESYCTTKDGSGCALCHEYHYPVYTGPAYYCVWAVVGSKLLHADLWIPWAKLPGGNYETDKDQTALKDFKTTCGVT